MTTGPGKVTPSGVAESTPAMQANVASKPFWVRGVLLAVSVLVLALATVIGIRLARGTQNLGEVKLHPYTAPDFAVDLFNGGRFSLGQERGRVVVVNFWASWCVPCQDEAPILESGWQRYGRQTIERPETDVRRALRPTRVMEIPAGQPVDFVGVDIKDTPDDARSFLRRYVSSYPNGFDAQKRIYIDYGVYGLPETFVINPEGLVVHHVIGPVSDSQLDSWLIPLAASSNP